MRYHDLYNNPNVPCSNKHRLRYSTLPLVFDDSLSYLEIISRLAARIDHIVDEVVDATAISWDYNQDTLDLDMTIILDPEYELYRHEPYKYCK